MGELSKVVGQWIVANTGWAVIIVLLILTGLFKITKIEINPIGWVLGQIGNALNKPVRNDISALKAETTKQIDELKTEYNAKITDLREDLDGFETKSSETISSLKERIDMMEKSNDMQTVRQIKAHVLEFANSCLNKHKHTKKEFDNIIAENQEYEVLVSKYGLVNDVYTEDYAYILKIYHRCLEENSFLKDSET